MIRSKHEPLVMARHYIILRAILNIIIIIIYMWWLQPTDVAITYKNVYIDDGKISSRALYIKQGLEKFVKDAF